MSQCDADPRVFEILLSHSDSSGLGGGNPGYLKMSDIALVPDEDGSTVSLRPFACLRSIGARFNILVRAVSYNVAM